MRKMSACMPALRASTVLASRSCVCVDNEYDDIEALEIEGETPEPPLKNGANTSEAVGGFVSPLFQGGLRGFLFLH